MKDPKLCCSCFSFVAKRKKNKAGLFPYLATMGKVKSVAVIGAGPGGAIAVDALAQEKAFDVIRVFERREKAGGCW